MEIDILKNKKGDSKGKWRDKLEKKHKRRKWDWLYWEERRVNRKGLSVSNTRNSDNVESLQANLRKEK